MTERLGAALASVHDQVTEVPVREVEEPLPGKPTPLPCPRDIGHGTDSWYQRRSLFHRYRVDRDDVQGNLLQPYGNAFRHFGQFGPLVFMPHERPSSATGTRAREWQARPVLKRPPRSDEPWGVCRFAGAPSLGIVSIH